MTNLEPVSCSIYSVKPNSNYFNIITLWDRCNDVPVLPKEQIRRLCSPDVSMEPDIDHTSGGICGNDPRKIKNNKEFSH